MNDIQESGSTPRCYCWHWPMSCCIGRSKFCLLSTFLYVCSCVSVCICFFCVCMCLCVGYSTIYSLRLRDSRDSQDSETPETPRLPRLRDSRGFCHITFQFSFISDLQQKNLLDVTQLENCSQCHPVSKFWAKLQFMV